MIKKSVVLLIVLLLGTFILSPTRKDTFYIIHFETQGGSSIPSYEGTIERFFNTPIPYKEGFIFEGWYLDDTYETLFDFQYVENDLTLYAKYRELGGNLVFHLGIIPKKNTHEVSLYLNGQGFVHAYDIEIRFDDNLTLTSYKSHLNQVINVALDARVRFNYIDLEEGIHNPDALISLELIGEDVSLNNFEIIIHEVYHYKNQTIYETDYILE